MMNVTQQKQHLDSFARKMSGVVTKYLCFGTYQKAKQCSKCNVVRQCKEASH